MIYTELTKKALKISFDAHKNQTDKTGMPYVYHPYQVAAQMDDEISVCVALLHDVVEDTEITIEDLKNYGFPEEVTNAVSVLTHDKSVPYMEYVSRIKTNPIAKKVKLADLKHNSDCTRLSHITPHIQQLFEKYKKAIEYLSDDGISEIFKLDDNFRGNVCIIQNNEILYESSSGFSDLPNEIPNSAETKFASASAGKVFVAVGILQLIEQGKLHFNDTLGDIFDIDLHNIDSSVTVEQLLNHTSGIPDYFDESVMDEYEELWVDFPNYKIRHNRDLLPLFIDKPMMYPKGSKFQYNNSGYVVLAMIIEKITGMDFDKYLKKNVFDVCGMTSTGYYELDKLPAKCANNYIYCSETNDYRTNIFSVDAKGTGAGGAFITVGDIIKFWKALLNGELLSINMVSEMFSKHSGDGTDFYGFGVWIIDNPNGHDYVYFQGCDPGVSFISEYNSDKKIISVLVSNYGDNVWAEMDKIRKKFYS